MVKLIIVALIGIGLLLFLKSRNGQVFQSNPNLQTSKPILPSIQQKVPSKSSIQVIFDDFKTNILNPSKIIRNGDKFTVFGGR